MHSDTIPPI